MAPPLNLEVWSATASEIFRSLRAARRPTVNMNLKSAALLAFIGTVLVAALLWNLIENILNVARGLLPEAALFSSLIYAFGAFTLAVFFFVFYKAQR
jgi:hypothetical protein